MTDTLPPDSIDLSMPLPLLCIPGLMNDARVWKNQRDAFAADRDVRIADSATHDTIAALATQALANAPGERFALAGFSLGGYVALEMIRQAPDRVAALALVDTGPRPDTPDATAMRLRMIAAVDAGPANFDAVLAGYLPRLVHPSRVDDAALIESLASMARAVGIAGFVRQQNAAMTRRDSRPSLRDIHCPTLVFCSREDQITPLALSEEMAALIPGARLVVAETCGHMAPFEQPAALNDAMAGWLESVTTS